MESQARHAIPNRTKSPTAISMFRRFIRTPLHEMDRPRDVPADQLLDERLDGTNHLRRGGRLDHLAVVEHHDVVAPQEDLRDVVADPHHPEAALTIRVAGKNES